MMTFLLTWSILVRISFERRAEIQKTNKTVTPKIAALLPGKGRSRTYLKDCF